MTLMQEAEDYPGCQRFPCAVSGNSGNKPLHLLHPSSVKDVTGTVMLEWDSIAMRNAVFLDEQKPFFGRYPPPQLSPSTNLLRLNLHAPGTEATVGMALGITEALQLHHHGGVTMLRVGWGLVYFNEFNCYWQYLWVPPMRKSWSLTGW